jgi:hypothetical protein
VTIERKLKYPKLKVNFSMNSELEKYPIVISSSLSTSTSKLNHREVTIERKLKYPKLKVNFSMNSELEKYPKLKVNLSLKFNFKIESPRSDNRKKTKVFRIRKI